MPDCRSCGRFVSTQFARVFGNAKNGIVGGVNGGRRSGGAEVESPLQRISVGVSRDESAIRTLCGVSTKPLCGSVCA
ncbi:DUF7563 family protein [Natrarchaeobius versutus]|uniref:DUF7563 family protein n=1 Tax=Natrarchaeobius versutus TaxID=1679078 RepID=UPI003F7D2852